MKRLLLLLACCCLPAWAQAQQPASSDASSGAAAALDAMVGHVVVVPLPGPVTRVVVGDPKVADFRLISPTEIYVLGRSVGTTNVVLWRRGGASTSMVVNVGMDTQPLAHTLRLNLPAEREMDVRMVAGAVVLSGTVSNALASEAAMNLAEAFMKPAAAGGAAPVRVINLLRVRDTQQVMLDVRIAEVSKSLLDKLGVGVQAGGGTNPRWNILSNFLGGGNGTAALLFGGGRAINLEAEKKDGLVRILAEPTIVAMSGKEGSFLVGGKVFIPVAQSSTTSSTSITLEEREYGVGLKFVPTVLDGGRVALKVATEVSEIAKETLSVDSRLGSGVSPAFTTRRVATSVQLVDGQSLVIGGLIRNNVSASTNVFPFLGELPVLGALFRSNQYASDLTELVVVVRASLVKATDAAPPLPTDAVAPPSRREFFLDNRLQGAPASLPAPSPVPGEHP